MTDRTKGLRILPLLILLGGLGGCGSSGGSYINPDIDFGYMRRAAVLPFENLSRDELADERIQSIFLTELLREEILEIIDPRETVAALQSIGATPGRPITPEKAVALGEKLSVDALFFGVVEEYGYSRGDRQRGPEVTVVFGMSETQTGAVVWRAQVHETGSSFWRRLFGGGTEDLYEVSRQAVLKGMRSLL